MRHRKRMAWDGMLVFGGTGTGQVPVALLAHSLLPRKGEEMGGGGETLPSAPCVSSVEGRGQDKDKNT